MLPKATGGLLIMISLERLTSWLSVHFSRDEWLSTPMFIMHQSEACGWFPRVVCLQFKVIPLCPYQFQVPMLFTNSHDVDLSLVCSVCHSLLLECHIACLNWWNVLIALLDPCLVEKHQTCPKQCYCVILSFISFEVCLISACQLVWWSLGDTFLKELRW